VLLKNPNEVQALGPDRVLVTLDKEAKAGSLMEVAEGALERLTGKVLLLSPGEARIVADGLNMANGIALSPDGRTAYVAELVGRSLVLFDRDLATSRLTRRGTVPLGAAPDNLTVRPDGRVLIAGHPKLLTLALGYQKSEYRRSPSMVLVYDPATNNVRQVMSSDGSEIAASLVAVMDPLSRNVLIGSAFGPHVLQCKFAGL
jgi:sugar lactone lactonase YvrE